MESKSSVKREGNKEDSNRRGRENRKTRSIEDKIILFFVEKENRVVDLNTLTYKIVSEEGIRGFEMFVTALYNLTKQEVINYSLIVQKLLLVKKEEALYRVLELKRRETALVLCSLLLYNKKLIQRGYEVIFNKSSFLLHSDEYIARSNIFSSAQVYYDFVKELKGKGLIKKVNGKDEYILLYEKIPKPLLNLIFSLLKPTTSSSR